MRTDRQTDMLMAILCSYKKRRSSQNTVVYTNTALFFDSAHSSDIALLANLNGDDLWCPAVMGPTVNQASWTRAPIRPKYEDEVSRKRDINSI